MEGFFFIEEINWCHKNNFIIQVFLFLLCLLFRHCNFSEKVLCLWFQAQYHHLWVELIKKHMMEHSHFSQSSHTLELTVASKAGSSVILVSTDQESSAWDWGQSREILLLRKQSKIHGVKTEKMFNVRMWGKIFSTIFGLKYKRFVCIMIFFLICFRNTLMKY